MIYFFTQILSILDYNYKSTSLVNQIIKLQHKIYITNEMNCLILRQIKDSVQESGADNHRHFPELSSGDLTSNKWNVVGNTL